VEFREDRRPTGSWQWWHLGGHSERSRDSWCEIPMRPMIAKRPILTPVSRAQVLNDMRQYRKPFRNGSEPPQIGARANMCRRPKLSAERADHHNVIRILALIVMLAGMAGAADRRTTPRSEPRDQAHAQRGRNVPTARSSASRREFRGPCFAPFSDVDSYFLRRITDGTHRLVWRHTGAWQRLGMVHPSPAHRPRSGCNISLAQRDDSPEGLLTVDTEYR
jgi:hypothetical protein